MFPLPCIRPALTRHALVAAASALVIVLAASPTRASEQPTPPSQGGSADEAAPDAAETAQPPGWQTMRYRGLPLSLSISPREESALRFPWRVKPAMPSQMVGMVDPVTIGDTFYLTPASPFEETKFWFESQETGAMIYMNIRAAEDAPPARVRVLDTRADEAVAEAGEPPREGTGASRATEPVFHTKITLARFAMREVYAPDRLRMTLEGLTEQPLGQPTTVDDLVPGATVSATPWKEWRTSDGRYVTILRVRNLGPRPASLDPTRRRHTRFQIASVPRSPVLAPRGELGDETALVVIATAPWRDAIAWVRR